MERQFPKNVRQIGNVSDEPKIYVEDYVDTYLNQLKEKAAKEPVMAVLAGEIVTQEGQEVRGGPGGRSENRKWEVGV